MKRTRAKHDSSDCGLLKDVEFRIATLTDTEDYSISVLAS